VSGNPDGTDSDRGRSERPIFTDDGTKILFESNGTLIRGEPRVEDSGQLYMKDLATGNVTLVSANANGTAGGNQWSHNASITADGLTIAFESNASDLGPSDTNDRGDVYVARLHGADLVTTLAPLSTTGPGGTTTIRATVENRGPHDGPRARVVVVLPAGLSFVNAETQAGGCTRPSAEHPGVVVCELGDLAPGDTASATVTATVTGSGGQVVALGLSDAVDPDSTNNSATRSLGD
jgi:Domain of unknown function DUF11/WD40-like Beta Propeller Repeat